MNVKRLPAKKLYTFCDLKNLGFKNTSEVTELTEILGHKRAMGAIEFGLPKFISFTFFLPMVEFLTEKGKIHCDNETPD